jgi:hypothetical protein
MAQAFSATVMALRQGGLTIRPVQMGDMLDRLSSYNLMFTLYEGARVHRARYEQHGSRLEDIADLVREGLTISRDSYDEGMRYVAECKLRVRAMRKATPVIVAGRPALPLKRVDRAF